MLLISEEKSKLKIFIAKADKRNTKLLNTAAICRTLLQKKKKNSYIYEKKIKFIDRIEKIRKKTIVIG